MIRVRKEADEVLYPDEKAINVSCGDIVELKRLAMANPRKRVRLCVHRGPDDRLHEMFIVHMRGCYVRPHKHLNKVEAMAVIEGEADVVLFQEHGGVEQVLSVGAPGTGRIFYQRLDLPIYHTILIRSEYFVFHEITEGPFVREQTIFPSWAPTTEGEAPLKYIENVEQQIKIWRRNHGK